MAISSLTFKIMQARRPRAPPSIILDDGSDDVGSVRSLPDVPEDAPLVPSTPSTPYYESVGSASASGSTLQTTAKPPRSSGSRKSSSRSLGAKASSENLAGNSASRRTLSNASSAVAGGSSTKERGSTRAGPAMPRMRSTPRLPVEKDADDAPSAEMCVTVYRDPRWLTRPKVLE